MTTSKIIPFPKTPTARQTPIEHTGSSSSTPSTPLPLYSYWPKSQPQKPFAEKGRGVQHIPHTLFEFMVKATNSRTELAVLCCLIRFTLGFHRAQCQVSYSFIALWTGLSVASVRRGISDLVQNGLVVGVSQASGISTTYEVPIVKAHLSSQNFSSELNSLDPAPPCPQEAHHPAGYRQTSVPPPGNKKENIKKKLKTLSPNGEKVISEYLSNLKPEQKKLRERSHFESLKKAYPVDEIALSVAFLLKNGLPGSKELCHSPMAFLSFSMDRVLGIARSEQQRLAAKLIRDESAEQQRAEAQKQRLEEDEWFERAKARFETEFPTPESERTYLSGVAIRFPFFSKNSVALRNAAISQWAKDRGV